MEAKHVLVSGAVVCAVALAFASGDIVGDQAARTALRALPTPTPHVIIHTRTVTRIVVVTPTPVPPPPGPQHRLSGATYCTDDRMCVRPVGYTLRAAPPEGTGWTTGRQWKRLDVWFHVENRGLFDNSLSTGQFAAGIRGWSVVSADGIPDEGSAHLTLVAGGATDGKETFDVPAASHAATIRFLTGFFDDKLVGTWDITYWDLASPVLFEQH